MDGKILKLISSKEPQKFAKDKGFDYHDGMIRLMINMNELNDSIMTKIKETSTIEVTKGNNMQISIPANKISELSLIDEINNIKPTLPAIQNRDIIIDGKIMEESVFFNYTKPSGSANVAVIDIAFDGNNEKIANNVVENISFRNTFEDPKQMQNVTESFHGTAMAQIITSVAPNANLYLLSAGTELEFIDAMDYAISKEVDIITISYTWLNYDTDGTSSITKKVEDAINSKITVVMPSGNYAENHWEGVFVDTDGDKWHEFENLDEGLTITVNYERIFEEKPILVYLRWSDDTENVSDFDITLMDSGGRILDYSYNTQERGSDESIEYLYHMPEIPGEYYIGISNFGNQANAKMNLFSVYDKLEYYHVNGSAAVPSDAKGAIVVGSIGDDNTRKTYSSVGPTDNGLNVPNILTKDGLLTEVYNDEPFYGTSSSAAYISGLITILYSEIQDIDPLNIPSILNENMLLSNSTQNSNLSIMMHMGNLDTNNSYNSMDWYESLKSDSPKHGFPIKFIDDEEKSNEITCEPNMVKILKKSTSDYVCVTETTSELLTQRGWGY